MFGPGRSSGFGVGGDTYVWTGENHLDLVLSMETHICLNWGRSSGHGSVYGDMNLLGLHNSHAMQMQDDTDFRRSLCQNVAQNKRRHH